MFAPDPHAGQKLTQAITPTAGAAGTSDINGAIIDMDGFEGVTIDVTFGAIVATAVTSIKAQQGNDSGLSDAADLEGTGITVADDDDEKIFRLHIRRLAKRYLRVVVNRGTANATVASAQYTQYGAAALPVQSQGSGVGTVESHVSPAEGTA